jgi:hypothetical protein
VRIGGVGASTIQERLPRRDASLSRDAEPSDCRALIPIEPPAPSDRTGTTSRRPLAPFLAHLIATKTDAPQTRAKRRAAPADVTGLYRAAGPRRIARTKFDRKR